MKIKVKFRKGGLWGIELFYCYIFLWIKVFSVNIFMCIKFKYWFNILYVLSVCIFMFKGVLKGVLKLIVLGEKKR